MDERHMRLLLDALLPRLRRLDVTQFLSSAASVRKLLVERGFLKLDSLTPSKHELEAEKKNKRKFRY